MVVLVIPASVLEKLDEIGEEGTRMEPDILLMRDVIIDIVGVLDELNVRVERMEGRREPG